MSASRGGSSRLSRKRKNEDSSQSQASSALHDITDDFEDISTVFRLPKKSKIEKLIAPTRCRGRPKKSGTGSTSSTKRDTKLNDDYEDFVNDSPLTCVSSDQLSEDIFILDDEFPMDESFLCKDEKLCVSCKHIVSAAVYSNHLRECLQKFKHSKRETRSISSSSGQGLSQKSLNQSSNPSSTPESTVSDGVASEKPKSKQIASVSDKENLPILPCPICLKPLKSKSGRQSHIKSCGPSHGLSTEKVLQAVKLQEKQAEERSHLGLPLITTQSLGVPLDKENEFGKIAKPKKKVKEPNTSKDPDLAMAIALSRSVAEEEAEKRASQEEKLLALGLDKIVEEDRKTKPVVVFQFPKGPQKNAKVKDKGRGSKGRKNLRNTVLANRSASERERIISEKVASILTADNTSKANWEDDAIKGGRRILSKFQDKNCSLWDTAHSQLELPLEDHYVKDLEPFIQPRRTEVGNLFRRYSDIAGRLNVTAMQAIEENSDSGSDVEEESIIEGYCTQLAMADLLGSQDLDITRNRNSRTSLDISSVHDLEEPCYPEPNVTLEAASGFWLVHPNDNVGKPMQQGDSSEMNDGGDTVRKQNRDISGGSRDCLSRCGDQKDRNSKESSSLIAVEDSAKESVDSMSSKINENVKLTRSLEDENSHSETVSLKGRRQYSDDKIPINHDCSVTLSNDDEKVDNAWENNGKNSSLDSCILNERACIDKTSEPAKVDPCEADDSEIMCVLDTSRDLIFRTDSTVSSKLSASDNRLSRLSQHKSESLKIKDKDGRSSRCSFDSDTTEIFGEDKNQDLQDIEDIDVVFQTSFDKIEDQENDLRLKSNESIKETQNVIRDLSFERMEGSFDSVPLVPKKATVDSESDEEGSEKTITYHDLDSDRMSVSPDIDLGDNEVIPDMCNNLDSTLPFQDHVGNIRNNVTSDRMSTTRKNDGPESGKYSTDVKISSVGNKRPEPVNENDKENSNDPEETKIYDAKDKGCVMECAKITLAKIDNVDETTSSGFGKCNRDVRETVDTNSSSVGDTLLLAAFEESIPHQEETNSNDTVLFDDRIDIQGTIMFQSDSTLDETIAHEKVSNLEETVPFIDEMDCDKTTLFNDSSPGLSASQGESKVTDSESVEMDCDKTTLFNDSSPGVSASQGESKVTDSESVAHTTLVSELDASEKITSRIDIDEKKGNLQKDLCKQIVNPHEIERKKGHLSNDIPRDDVLPPCSKMDIRQQKLSIMQQKKPLNLKEMETPCSMDSDSSLSHIDRIDRSVTESSCRIQESDSLSKNTSCAPSPTQFGSSEDKILEVNSDKMHKKLVYDWSALLASGEGSDVKITTNDEQDLNAHSIVLLARCPDLYAEVKHANNVVSWNVSYEAGYVFLAYIYTALCSISTKDDSLWMDVFDLALKYDCEELVQYLESLYKLSNSPIKKAKDIRMDSESEISLPKLSIKDIDSTRTTLKKSVTNMAGTHSTSNSGNIESGKSGTDSNEILISINTKNTLENVSSSSPNHKVTNTKADETSSMARMNVAISDAQVEPSSSNATFATPKRLKQHIGKEKIVRRCFSLSLERETTLEKSSNTIEESLARDETTALESPCNSMLTTERKSLEEKRIDPIPPSPPALSCPSFSSINQVNVSYKPPVQSFNLESPLNSMSRTESLSYRASTQSPDLFDSSSNMDEVSCITTPAKSPLIILEDLTRMSDTVFTNDICSPDKFTDKSTNPDVQAISHSNSRKNYDFQKDDDSTIVENDNDLVTEDNFVKLPTKDDCNDNSDLPLSDVNCEEECEGEERVIDLTNDSSDVSLSSFCAGDFSPPVSEKEEVRKVISFTKDMEPLKLTENLDLLQPTSTSVEDIKCPEHVSTSTEDMEPLQLASTSTEDMEPLQLTSTSTDDINRVGHTNTSAEGRESFRLTINSTEDNVPVHFANASIEQKEALNGTSTQDMEPLQLEDSEECINENDSTRDSVQEKDNCNEIVVDISCPSPEGLASVKDNLIPMELDNENIYISNVWDDFDDVGYVIPVGSPTTPAKDITKSNNDTSEVKSDEETGKVSSYRANDAPLVEVVDFDGNDQHTSPASSNSSLRAITPDLMTECHNSPPISPDIGPDFQQPLLQRIAVTKKVASIPEVSEATMLQVQEDFEDTALWRDEFEPDFDEEQKTNMSTRGRRKPQNPIKTPRHKTTSRKATTPMLDYRTMPSPDLKNELKKYGIKPISRSKAVTILEHVYEKTHPLVTDSEADSSFCETPKQPQPSTSTVRNGKNSSSALLKKATAQNQKKITKKVIPPKKDVTTKTLSKVPAKAPSKSSSKLPSVNEDEDDDDRPLDLSQTSSTSEGSERDCIEESMMLGMSDEDNAISATQKGDLISQVTQFITSDPEFHRNVLLYEPFFVEDLQASLKANGVKCNMASLLGILDEQCITFRTKQGQWNRQRGRKCKRKGSSTLNNSPKRGRRGRS